MFKNLTFLAVAGLLLNTGCIITTGDGTESDTNASSASTSTSAGTATTTESGSSSGTEGTATGSGTETTTTGAPTTGTPTTGTTEATTGSTGSTGSTGGDFGNCGWNANDKYYGCGFMGEDPEGVSPIACPDTLPADGDPCDENSPINNVGCCTPEGANYYCTALEAGMIVIEQCG